MSALQLAQVLARVESIRASGAYVKPTGDMHDLLTLADRIKDLEAEAVQVEPIGDIRALKYRIHELEGEVIGYKRILDDAAQEPAYWITNKGDLYSSEEVAKQYAPNNTLTPLYTTPEPAPEFTEVADGLPEIGVPVLAMINDKPYIYPFCRDDAGDDGWLWAGYKIGPLNDPASYEADDDYDVVRWMLMPAPRSKA